MLSHLPLEDPEDLKESPIHSLRRYGRVVQIKRRLRGTHFEGDAMVMPDVSKVSEKTHQKLERMLYLETWDYYAPATFIGAPSVCYHCRRAGHGKLEWPRMAEIICFHCKGRIANLGFTMNKKISFGQQSINRSLSMGSDGFPILAAIPQHKYPYPTILRKRWFIQNLIPMSIQ
jgi:hypothetical protein